MHNWQKQGRRSLAAVPYNDNRANQRFVYEITFLDMIGKSLIFFTQNAKRRACKYINLPSHRVQPDASASKYVTPLLWATCDFAVDASANASSAAGCTLGGVDAS